MNRWEDLIEVPLPLPFPLKIIKSYLIRGSQGYTMIDTGLHYQGGLDAWEEATKKIGFGWDEVEQIVLTHYHPDHYGLAGLMQQRTGVAVKMSETDYRQARLFFDRDSVQPDDMSRFYAEHGLSSDWVQQIPSHLRGFQRWVEPHPEPTFIQAGDTVRLGDRDYEIFHTPGHADGHLSFYDPERKWLIGGDFLLSKITPNISLWPGCDPDPLHSYLHTLEKMKELPVERVFPSHGPVFEDYIERIEALQQHHRDRLNEMKHTVKEAEKMTAAELCFRIFGENLSIHNLRFALAETLAHLEYLNRCGELIKEKQKGHWVYRGR
ncbi:MBL fold metallo-hydrolase [Kroppenstedtia pulmonis]|uniref:MBL fold metallo-hydrolase n=1 Tax=Kroppenstedtia pulmonis TaxID=1380685 RepID=A0A7D4BIM4_9BACL|nr:MBL fold metallo-hydrolase [Kroppenstedtia pulmonis]QKG83730.1 MBL fold metallo-hydrolase [Kroppenstedtia pulmonis]